MRQTDLPFPKIFPPSCHGYSDQRSNLRLRGWWVGLEIGSYPFLVASFNFQRFQLVGWESFQPVLFHTLIRKSIITWLINHTSNLNNTSFWANHSKLHIPLHQVLTLGSSLPNLNHKTIGWNGQEKSRGLWASWHCHWYLLVSIEIYSYLLIFRLLFMFISFQKRGKAVFSTLTN